MKILMLCDFYGDNLQYQENLLAKYYHKHSHEVTIVASTIDNIFDYLADKYESRKEKRDYFLDDVRIIRLPYQINLLNKLRKFRSIRSLLEDIKPDLIFAHDIHLNIIDAVAYKKKNSHCKLIMDYHADFSNSANSWISLNILHKVIRKSFLSYVRKEIDKIYPVVPASADFLHKVYGLPYKEMQLLPLGADTDLVNVCKQQESGKRIREQLGIAKDEKVIFTGGKLTPTKKTEILIQAFLNMAADDVHLIIVGNSNDDEVVYKENLYNIGKRSLKIHFTGWLDSVTIFEYLNASDIAVFPASQSILWQQAISMGLPLIVGDIGNQSIEYLNKYDNIISLKKDEISVSAIEALLMRVFAESALLTNMRHGAERVSDEMLNYDKIIMQTLTFD